MNKRIQLLPPAAQYAETLELVVINSLKFNEKDGPLRELVRQAFKEVQVPVLEYFGENVEDKALRPTDSIGSTREPGQLTDSNDPSPGYHHIYLVELPPKGEWKDSLPVGMRITDEFRAPKFGNVLMEYFTAMVRPDRAERRYYVNLDKLNDNANGEIPLLTLHQILMMLTKHLSKSPDKFKATLSDGVGIKKAVLASMGYERFGPEGKTMLWVPPLNAETKEQYEIAIPAQLYVRFGSRVANHRFPESAALFIAVRKYIKEGYADEDVLGELGIRINNLPCVVKTREAIKAVSAKYSGYIPCSPIK